MSPVTSSNATAGIAIAAALSLTCLVLVRRKQMISSQSQGKDDEGGKQFVVRRARGDDEYAPALPTVPKDRMKKRDLFTEPKTGRFALELILSPFQKYPAHLHGSNEWCFLVQGELKDQFGTKYAGDFFYNELRSLHYSIQAGSEGCTILVVKDEGGNIPRPELDASH